MEVLSLVMLACITALLSAPTCSAFPKDQQARRPPLAQGIRVRDSVNISFPLDQPPQFGPSITTTDISPTPTCQTYSCNIFYQYVSIYYWPTDSQNTACLGSMLRPLTTAPPLGIPLKSPSIYAIFPSIRASDGCNQIGKGYGPITTSFAPGELSTIDIRFHSTNVFNFADLPCPPPGIELPPGSSTYAPLIAPPSFIFDLDPAFSTCIPGYSQGVDPPTALPTADGISGPVLPGARRDLGAREKNHVAPWAPRRTVGPSDTDPL